MNQYVYHFKPRGMFGRILMPLNQLRESLPEVYADQVRKYKGREHLLLERIEVLDCLWNDVLHLSPIHPQIIIDCWRENGLENAAGFSGILEVYKIPVTLLQSETTVTYQSFNFDFSKNDPSLDKFFRFDPLTFKEQTSVSPEQLQIWKNDAKSGRRLFWYSHTMHILAKQRIDTRECELISCK